VAVALPAGPIAAAALRAAFDATYERLYGRTIPGLEVEALTWLLALAERRALPDPAPPAPPADPGPAGGTRAIIDPATGRAATAAIWRRADLPPGARLAGPAVVTEDGTSCIVPPGFTASIGPGGELLIEDDAP
jgi:N-methylhydantoinase A